MIKIKTKINDKKRKIQSTISFFHFVCNFATRWNGCCKDLQLLIICRLAYTLINILYSITNLTTNTAVVIAVTDLIKCNYRWSASVGTVLNWRRSGAFRPDFIVLLYKYNHFACRVQIHPIYGLGNNNLRLHFISRVCVYDIYYFKLTTRATGFITLIYYLIIRKYFNFFFVYTHTLLALSNYHLCYYN